MDFPIQPLNSNLVIKRIEAESVTRGGIVLPDIAKGKPTRGLVIATGPGKVLDCGVRVPTGIEPGDVVVYPPNYGTEVQFGGVELTFLDADNVTAKEIDG